MDQSQTYALSDRDHPLFIGPPLEFSGTARLPTGESINVKVGPDLNWLATSTKPIPTEVVEEFLTRDIVVSTRFGEATIQRPFISTHTLGVIHYEGTCTAVRLSRPSTAPFDQVLVEYHIDEASCRQLLFNGLGELELPFNNSSATPVHARDPLNLRVSAQSDPCVLRIQISSILCSPDEADYAATCFWYLAAWLLGVSAPQRSRMIYYDFTTEERIELRRLPRFEATSPARKFRPIPSSPSDWYLAEVKSKRFAGQSYSLCTSVLSEGFLASALNALLASKAVVYAIEYLRLADTTPVDATGALLSVALEALASSLLTRESLEVVAPAIWNPLRDELARQINTSASLQDEGSKGARKVLVNRLGSVNQQPNQLKLTDVFERLGVALTALEVDAIGRRNVYLHSGGILVHVLGPSLEEVVDAHLVEATLASALNRLVLRRLGYRGPVFDWGAYGSDKWRPRGQQLEFEFSWLE